MPLDVMSRASTVGLAVSRDAAWHRDDEPNALSGTVSSRGPVLKDGEARELASLVYDQSGIVLSGDKKSLISSRLQKRLRALGLNSFRDYVRYLRTSPHRDSEIVAMIDEVSTNKTEFFRESQHFDFLVSHVLPALPKSDWTVLNLWCAGCSTGEEPYSLAMVLAEYFGATRNFNIFATDLCTRALWTARQAVYPNDLGRSIPLVMRRKYTLTGHSGQKGRFRIVPELRERVTFEYANLMAHDWNVPAAMNAVFCRNVMIYFDFETRRRVVGQLRRHLKADGHLFIGHAESLNGIDRALGLVQLQPTVYAVRK